MRKTTKALAVAITLLSGTAGPTAAAPISGDAARLVRIESGRLDGIRLASGVEAYLGVPYAAAPVGDLRWREPRPVQPWAGVRHADRFAPQCVQPQRGPLTNQYSGPEVTSEDCLYLNVWTRPGAKKAPVIVYLHGGAFFVGSGSMGLYGGEEVARKGAVYVNLNYRLGALGFLAHPSLSAESPSGTSGNYAFLDQIAALRWVKRNIEQFGGDPDNVTIVGQSAGSMSVLVLQSSPLAKGLFHRAVGMSGAQFGGGGLPPPPPAERAAAEGVRFQDLVKAKDLAEMRALPADRLTIPRSPGAPSIGPSQDGYVLPEPAASAFAGHRQNDVPLLLGFTRDEALGGFGPIKDLADYRAKAAARFGSRAEEFLQLYPAATDEEARAQARLSDRDSTMAIGMDAWARGQAQQGNAPVFSYEFARPHTYQAGVRFSDLDPATAGAYHTSEVPFWLGTLDSFNAFRRTRDWTAGDRAFSAAMTKSLVAFARTGDPDTATLKWPRYDPARPQLLRLGEQPAIAPWPDARRLSFFRSVQPARPPSGAAPRD